MTHKKYREEKDCLNCGATVEENFCPRCGQENLDLRENFFHMVGHFISDYLHFDSKFFRSLIPLFTRPGFLTRQYWDGKRIKYIHPLRLFFFVTIIFMIATSAYYNRMGDVLKDAIVKGDQVLKRFDDSYLSSLSDSASLYIPEWKDTLTVNELREAKISDATMTQNFRSGVDHFFIYLKYVTFLLLPVYALLFKLLYIRHRKFYVEQLVYTMHLQSFVYCLLTVLFVVPLIAPVSLSMVQAITFLSVLLYIGLSLHFLYRQVWWKTALKSLGVTVSLFFITAVAMVAFTVIYSISTE